MLSMSNAEVITILVAFHMSGHRCLKHFYLNHVRGHWGHLFPKTVSYNKFVGWFFGFKPHLINNEKGEVLSFMITPADVDDREPLKVKDFVKEIYGKLVGDKGYISKELFHELFVDGIQLITKVRNNMKNCLMSVSDKVLLRKRAVIESVNDELKNIAQLEHSRHRSFNNFIVNAVSALAAYCFFPKKPIVSLEYLFDNQLTLF